MFDAFAACGCNFPRQRRVFFRLIFLMSDPSDSQAAEQLRSGYEKLRAELGKRIVGQEDVIEQIFIAMAASGHALLEGVPGLAKTLAVRTSTHT